MWMPVPTTLWAKQIYDLGAAPKELNSQVPRVMTGDSFNMGLRAVAVLQKLSIRFIVILYTLIGADGLSERLAVVSSGQVR